MLEFLWVKIILLVIGIFAYLGIGKLLLTITSKKEGLGPAYFWLYLWPLSVVILTPVAVIILAVAAIIIALIVGLILGTLGIVIGLAGGFFGLVTVLFFAFFAWKVLVVVILSPFVGFEFFLSNVKKLPGYLTGRLGGSCKNRQEVERIK